MLQKTNQLNLTPIHKNKSHYYYYNIKPYTTLTKKYKQLSKNTIKKNQIKLKQNSNSIPT